MYSKDYQEIKNVFYKWIKAWENGRVESMKEYCVSDVKAHFSMFDPCNSWEELEKHLIRSTEKRTENWFEILSFAALTNGVKAQQSANIIALKTVKDEKNLNIINLQDFFATAISERKKGGRYLNADLICLEKMVIWIWQKTGTIWIPE